jgi:hypothetical protein
VRQTYAPRLIAMSRPLIAVGAVATVCISVTVWLWARYGETVFFETIRAGFAACFG